MQLNGVQIMCSSELEEPLTYFLQSDLAAKGIEVRRRSDFDDVLTANILAQDANEIPDDMELEIEKLYFDEEPKEPTGVKLVNYTTMTK